jgi:hypothetical protein
MHTCIRRLHLFAGLILLVFVTMYFVTGYVMLHEKWFPHGNAIRSSRTERLPYAGERGTADFARYLERTFAIHGQPQEPRRQPDGGWKFLYARPGMNYEVIISANGDSATITQSQTTAVGLLHGLHRLHGYQAGRLYRVWAVLYDMASVALIVFAASGVYLWYHSATDLRFGWVCLGFSFGFSGAMILYLWWSR